MQLVGTAAEISYAATLARFENFQEDAQLGFLSLGLSGWLYRFANVCASVLVAATSVVALRTSVLPRWLAWAGFVVALIALLHPLVPEATLLLRVLWVLAVSVFMLAGSVGSARDAAATQSP